jgi:multiple sugar transport system ATP-binding protein
VAFARTTALKKSFGKSAALCGVDLQFPAGMLTVILGPSGCGKTTLLRVIAGLEEPECGQVVIDGRVVNDPASRVPSEKRGLGMVFQDSLLWPHLTVRQNISFPLGAGKQRDPRVAEAAEAAEVAGFLDRYPSALSGGEQRRASIARAIVGRPRLLLFDEPLSGLDANLRVRLLSTIRRIQRQWGLTAIYVTHDQEEALSLADQLVVMRAGKLLQVGTSEEVYRQPRSAFVAAFVGLSTLIPGVVGEGRAETDLGGFGVDGLDSGAWLFAARPETVHLCENGGAPGRVVGSSFRGDRWLVEVEVLERRVLSWSPVEIAAGRAVSVKLDPSPVPVLDDRRQA